MNKLPETIRESSFARLYEEVRKAPIGEVLSFARLSSKEVRRIVNNLHTQARRGHYGEGISVRTTSQTLTNGLGKKSKVLYVTKEIES